MAGSKLDYLLLTNSHVKTESEIYSSKRYIDGLAQDCGNPNGFAMELLQSCAKPLICTYIDLLTLMKD